MLNTVLGYLSAGNDFVSAKLTTAASYVPTPLANAVSFVAKVAFHKYSLIAYGVGASYVSVNSLLVKNLNEKRSFKTVAAIKNTPVLMTVKKTVAPALVAVACFVAAYRK